MKNNTMKIMKKLEKIGKNKIHYILLEDNIILSYYDGKSKKKRRKIKKLINGRNLEISDEVVKVVFMLI